MEIKSTLHALCITPYYKPAYIYGGPVQSIVNLCEGLAQAGVSVHVVTTNANGSSKLSVPLYTPIDLDGVVISYFPLDFRGLTFFYSSSLSREIHKRVRAFNIAIVETLWGHPLIPAVIACKRNHVPFIVSIRGQMNSWALANKNLKKKAYLSLIGRRLVNHAAAISCTDKIEEKAVKCLKLTPPTFVVPNGIHSVDYYPDYDTKFMRVKYQIPAEAVLLLFLGRLTQIKRPDIAVDVLSAVQSLPYDTHLLIVGPDQKDWRTRLEHQAYKLKCENKLHFAGLLDKKDVISVLSQSNLLIMPSEIQENFGNSALEAMAAGVPILVSEGIPIGTLAAEAGAGRVVQCSKESFQQSALELLSNLDQLSNMGKLGQELVRRRFDLSVVIHEMLLQYNSIISSGKPI